MLIPISWTVSKAVAMPGREKREKGQMKGRRGCREDGESVCRTQTEKSLAANVQPVNHRDTWP